MEGGLCDDLSKRHEQMIVRVKALREESELTREQLLQTQERIKELLTAQQALEITDKGVADMRPAADSIEAELEVALDDYTKAFSFFLLNANLIVRLEARTDGIDRALASFDPLTDSHGMWRCRGVRNILS